VNVGVLSEKTSFVDMAAAATAEVIIGQGCVGRRALLENPASRENWSLVAPTTLGRWACRSFQAAQDTICRICGQHDRME
jgi:hypothetical protein